jgi:hypothetical protein
LFIILSYKNYIRDIWVPNDARTFLGFVGAYRKYIPDLGILAIPLNDLATLLNPELDIYMTIPENRNRIVAPIDTIKAIVMADPCLTLPA